MGLFNRKAPKSCTVHILDPNGPERTETWQIGGAISQDAYDRLKGRNGDLYVSIAYEGGKPNVMAVKHELWLQMKAAMDEIESDALRARESVDKMMSDMFGRKP